MKGLLRGSLEQLRLMFASRLGLCLLGLLLAMSAVTGGIYSRLVMRDVPIVVVDLDSTHVTRLITTSLEATPELAVQPSPGGTIEEARERLERGEVAAYLLIPSGFTERMKHGEKASIVLATDMSNLLAGKTVRAACSRVFTTLNVGVEMSTLRKMGSSRAAAAAQAYPILVEDNQLFNPATNYAEYLVPITVYFLLHIYATVLFGGTFLETKEGKAPSRKMGELFTTWLISSFLAVLGWKWLPLAGVTMASPWWLGSLAFVAYAASQATFVGFVSMLVPSRMLAFQIVLVLSMLGMMLSGVTWPTYAFPPLLAKLSELLPYTHLGRLLRMTAHFEASLSDMSTALASLMRLFVGYGATAIVLAVLRNQLVHRFMRPANDVSR